MVVDLGLVGGQDQLLKNRKKLLGWWFMGHHPKRSPTKEKPSKSTHAYQSRWVAVNYTSKFYQVNNPASQLAALRRRISHVCPECDDPFVDLKTAIYCSKLCKRRAKYTRRKARDGNE